MGGWGKMRLRLPWAGAQNENCGCFKYAFEMYTYAYFNFLTYQKHIKYAFEMLGHILLICF